MPAGGGRRATVHEPSIESMRMRRVVEQAVHALLTPRPELPWLRSLAAQTIADICAEADGHGLAAAVRRTCGRNT
jgi:hypothetical protein